MNSQHFRIPAFFYICISFFGAVANASTRSPTLLVDADHSNRIYSVGESATFTVQILNMAQGSVVTGQLDGSPVNAVPVSAQEYTFSSGAFNDYQLGKNQFVVSVQPSQGAVQTETLYFSVRPENREITLARTGAVQTINVLSQIQSPSGSPLTITSVGAPGRGTAAIGPNGTIIYTPDTTGTQLYRIVEVDSSSSGTPGNVSASAGVIAISFGDNTVLFNSIASNLVSPAPPTTGVNGYLKNIKTGEITLAGAPSGWVPNSTVPGTTSYNARFFPFYSNATNFFPGANGVEQFYIRDRLSGALRLVTESVAGGPSSSGVLTGGVSSDGTHASFASAGPDLANLNPQGIGQIYDRNLVDGTTTFVSHDSNGNPANSSCGQDAISQDGRYTLFETEATNLASNATGGVEQYYVHDMKTDQNTLVSVSNSGSPVAISASGGYLSDDGQLASFTTKSSMATGASGNYTQPYLRNIQAGTTSLLVSGFPAGTELNANVSAHPSPTNMRYVGFATTATNVFAPATALPAGNAKAQCYFTDRTTGQTVQVNVNAAGMISTGTCDGVSPSDDGQYVAVAVQTASILPTVNDSLTHIYVLTKNDVFTYAVTDGEGNTFTGTVTLTEPLTGGTTSGTTEKVVLK